MDFNTSFELVKERDLDIEEAKSVISGFLETHEDLDDFLHAQLDGLLDSV